MGFAPPKVSIQHVDDLLFASKDGAEVPHSECCSIKINDTMDQYTSSFRLKWIHNETTLQLKSIKIRIFHTWILTWSEEGPHLLRFFPWQIWSRRSRCYLSTVKSIQVLGENAFHSAKKVNKDEKSSCIKREEYLPVCIFYTH